PRVGGEEETTYQASRGGYGTPPRRRGGRRRSAVRGRGRRNTPASAGRTTAPPPRTSPTAEHPRVGGEDCDWAEVSAVDRGTPPRRRGGLSCPRFRGVPEARLMILARRRTTSSASTTEVPGRAPRAGRARGPHHRPSDRTCREGSGHPQGGPARLGPPG